MISESNLGRYEYRDNNSDKYWHIIYDRTKQVYLAQWGKRSNPSPQGQKEYSEAEVRKKVVEKQKKGYYKVNGYQTSAGANSLHFIMED